MKPSSSVIAGQNTAEQKTQSRPTPYKFSPKMVAVNLGHSYHSAVCLIVIFSHQFGYVIQ